ncbi:unnamed protein product [Effrenium voratum]|nr:unnamed protein product [Effrenium voratum]
MWQRPTSACAPQGGGCMCGLEQADPELPWAPQQDAEKEWCAQHLSNKQYENDWESGDGEQGGEEKEEHFAGRSAEERNWCQLQLLQQFPLSPPGSKPRDSTRNCGEEAGGDRARVALLEPFMDRQGGPAPLLTDFGDLQDDLVLLQSWAFELSEKQRSYFNRDKVEVYPFQGQVRERHGPWRRKCAGLSSETGIPRDARESRFRGTLYLNRGVWVRRPPAAPEPGKSTLLNVLAGRQLTSRVFRIEGELRVNGRAVEPWRLRPRVAYVMQKDEFFATETPREAILFSARLRLPASHLSMLEEKGIDSYITQLLDSLGLSGCCDRRIGGASLNGISNGERKRVSIGVELITRPSIVFLDEPTTGLDSFSAWQVMRIVKDLADSGCTVVCTIHQPSSEIFALLDRVICLCHQRAIYHGPATELSRWLERSGRHVPRDYNPADYVMFLMETLPKSELELLCGTSRVSRDSSFRPSADGGSAPHRLEPAKMRKSFALQVWCLTQREWRNLRRDSASLKLRFVLTGFLTILFSLVFCNVGEHPVLAQLRRGGPWQALLSHPRLRRLQRLVNTQQVPLLQQLQQEIEYHYKARNLF